MKFGWFGSKQRPTEAEQDSAVNGKPFTVHVRVFRTLTMPDGKKLRVMREDAFQRALHPVKSKEVA